MKRLLALAGLTLALVWSAAALSATFTVTNTNDSGSGSLRDAVNLANSTPGPDTITFSAAVTGTITLTSGILRLQEAVNIIGPGRDVLTISGNLSSRIFSMIESASQQPCPALTGPTDYAVSLSGMTLTDGRRLVNNSNGGAIAAFKTLTLDSMRLRDSAANHGGGLYYALQHPGQTLTIINTEFINNTAATQTLNSGTENHGGGLAIEEYCPTFSTQPATVSISNSLFSGNRVQPTTLEGKGGGINVYSDASVTITDTRIIGNGVDIPNPPVANAIYGGGAIYGRAKSLSIVRSEIAGNSADVGGGLRFFNNVASLQTPSLAMAVTLINSTVSGNAANATGGAGLLFGNVALELDNSTVSDNLAAPTRTGGFTMNTGPTSPVTSGNALAPTIKLVSSVVANSGNGTNDISSNIGNMPAPVIDANSSLIETICPTCNITVSGGGNLIGVDPLLGPLANNGGPSRTHAILAGSPLINAGSNPLNLTTDQRGAGFPRVLQGVTDIGAYEAPLAPTPPGSATPLYRFNTGANHFYTASSTEKDYVQATFPSWTLEGIAYYVYLSPTAGALPVYRFNNGAYHFYTISEAEKNYVIATFPTWVLEGVAFYTPGAPAPMALPVYRFNTGSAHFYTISEAEKAYVLATFPTWVLEGIAYYARTAPN